MSSPVDKDHTTAEVEEALRIIGRAWQAEEPEYQGELLDIGPHPILPRPTQTPHPPLFLACSRAETLEQAARRIGIRGQRFFAQSIGHWYGGAGVPDEAVVTGADEAAGMREAAEQVVARLHELEIPVRPTSTATFNADHAYGSAQEAIAYVERLRAAGADEVMCLIQMGTAPQEACLETLRQWGDTVIPHFRNTAAGKAG